MKTKSLKINVVTLGCSKNTVDSEFLMKQLAANNIELVHDSNDTDCEVVIINTCGFISDAVNESINTILEFVRLKQNGILKHIFVIGCLVERYKKVLQAEIPEIEEYFGVNNFNEIIESLNKKYGEFHFHQELVGERMLTTPKHYAYLKISEGCDRTCAFCAIPMIRGKHISKSIEVLVDETKHLVAAGTKEIILIAQDISYYGIDLYGKQMLAPLVEQLAKIVGVEWLRLHYAYPANFPFEVIEIMKQNSNICRYLDIPFQHINDKMLKTMRRNYTKDDTIQLINKLRTEIPEIAIRTTFLVGHPGEHQEFFEELKQFVQQQRFERLGVFTYSHEEGTKSYKTWRDYIAGRTKKERRDELMEIQQEISFELNQKKVGQTYKVLIDSIEGEFFVGRTEFDSPEVDNEVHIAKSTNNLQVGNFYQIKIKEATDYDLMGEVEI